MQVRSLDRNARGDDGRAEGSAHATAADQIGPAGEVRAKPAAVLTDPLADGRTGRTDGALEDDSVAGGRGARSRENGEDRDGEGARQVSVAPGRFPSPNPLFPGCPGLFVQSGCSHNDRTTALSLVASEPMGILLTIDTRPKHYSAALRSIIEHYKQTVTTSDSHRGYHTGVGHVLADANRYSGKNRVIVNASGGAGNLDPAWIATQRDLGLPIALTDSPYVPSGDHAGLVAVLTEARELGAGVVAVLPLHLDWLKKDVARLIEAVDAAGVPIALVLEHEGDPLGVQAAVAGLVRLLEEATVQVALLRSDVSVIGAVAFGATFGAVGTTTGMRHLYPTKPNGSGGGRSARIATFVPRSMAYRSLDTLNSAIALDPENQERWTCPCQFCSGGMLSYIADEVQAYQHSLAAIAVLGEEVLSGATPLVRRRTWVARCGHAQDINLDISAETGLNWNPPNFQGAWRKLAPSLPPLP